MVYKCAACGCSCRYNKHDGVKNVISQLSPLKAHNLCLEGSALIQCSVLPLSATLLTSTQRTDAATERTNELSEACLATDVTQGCTLDAIQSRLNMETLPDGFVYSRKSDKLLLYKLDVSRGLIAVECGIILTSDFQVTCSSFNEVLPVNIYEDLLSRGKQITSISQLLNLVSRLFGRKQGHSPVKTEADVGCCEENYRAVTDVCDTKLETEETAICAVSKDLITQSSLSESYQSGGCEAEIYNNEKSAKSNCVMKEFKDEDQSDSETSETDNYVTDVMGTVRIATQGVIVPGQLGDETAQTTRCPLCKKNLCNFQYLNQHIQRVHQSEREHRCSQCEKSFSFKSHLTRHVKHMHEGKKLKSDKDELSTSCSQLLESLVSSEHFKKKFHKCTQCDSSFSRKGDLTHHIKTVHNQVKPYGCSSCDKKFSTRQHRDEHWRSVHSREKPYICDQCEFRCSQKGNLKEHMRAVHDGVRRYPCSQCSYRSGTNKDLLRHVRSVHYHEKPYLCTECGKAFSSPGSLKLHIDSVHRRLRPFSCAECDGRFAMNCHLQLHIKAVHRKERPHSCSECGKSFATASDVRKHFDTVHNDYKPFPCQQCSRRFTRRIVLSNHMRAMHQGTISLVDASVPAD